MRRICIRFLFAINSPFKVISLACILFTFVYVVPSILDKCLDYNRIQRSHIGFTGSITRVWPIKYGNFSFSRDDLRLEFKPLPKHNFGNVTYDNIAEFPCTMSKEEIETMTVNDTEDIMCIPRPQYLKEFKNPCFLDTHIPETKELHTYCLPYFHIIGFDKCGTTDFHSRLISHPEIIGNFGGLDKEVYFWSWLRFGHFEYSIQDKWRLRKYQISFPREKIIDGLIHNNVQLITGDASPMDVWDFRYWSDDPQNRGLDEPRFLTPHAMRHIYENPKFIVLMRDPVERTYSDYIFRQNGFTAEKFAVDVPIAISMMTDCLRTHSMPHCFFSDEMYNKLPMRLHISCYSVFLREWFSVFDRRHFMFIRTEDYRKDMIGTMKKAFQFLDVSELPESEVVKISQAKIKHETLAKKNAGQMFPKTRAILEEFFARFNEDLVTLLGDTRFLWENVN